jgi:Spy/CpxP family protein refolding chaperone
MMSKARKQLREAVMKHIKMYIGITAVLLLILVSACSNQNEVTAPGTTDFDSPQFALIDFDDAQNAVEEGTLEKEIVINDKLLNYSFMDGGLREGSPMMSGNPWMERFDFGKHLGRIFHQLQLNEEQKNAVKELMKAYHDRNKILIMEFRDANKSIIEAANIARKEIRDSVQAGTLSRADAKKQLDELNKTTRDAIAANAASLQIKEKMCESQKTLFSSIKGLLTEEQLVKWDSFISKMKTPCK